MNMTGAPLPGVKWITDDRKIVTDWAKYGKGEA